MTMFNMAYFRGADSSGGYDCESVVQIGKKPDELSAPMREEMTPDTVLHGNTSISKCLEREYLQ